MEIILYLSWRQNRLDFHNDYHLAHDCTVGKSIESLDW